MGRIAIHRALATTWQSRTLATSLLAILSLTLLACGNEPRSQAPGHADEQEGGAPGNSDDEASGGAGSDGTEPAPGVSLETSPVPPQSVEEDRDVGMALGGFDRARLVPESDLRVSVEAPPLHGTLEPERGFAPLAVRYVPNPHFNGSDQFSFVVSDSEGNRSEPRQVAIEVQPVNDPPRASDDSAETDSLTAVGIEVTANDVDVDDTELEIVAVTQPASGWVEIVSAGTILFRPRHPDSGRFTFQYTIEDPSGSEHSASVEITVVEAQAVVIESFTADLTVTRPEEAVTLRWTAPLARTCALDGGADAGGAPTGSVVVRPREPTRYTLTCQGPGGPVTASVVVLVETDGPDADDDGIPDAIEALTGTDLNDADSDDDGVPDGVEDQNTNGVLDDGETNPREPDSKGEGFCDGLRADNDGDGIAPASDCVGPVLVDASNQGEIRDGLSWQTAFSTIQEGADAAEPGREVWVRVGRYRAHAANASVLHLPAQLEVYGGFAGGETSRAARDRTSRETILDGDFLGDDSEVAAIDASNPQGNPAAYRADNSQHVVYGAEKARLDGFAVENGLAVASGPFQGGGGLLNRYPDMVVENVHFAANAAIGGGGAILCANSCDLTIRAATFAENRAVSGGAIRAAPTLAEGARFLEIEDVELTGNWALQAGGAIEVEGRTAVFAKDVSCRYNVGSQGGCWFGQDARLVMNAIMLTNNSAKEGGGVYLSRSELVLEEESSFLENGADWGGGILNYLSKVTVSNARFARNTAEFGGAVFNRNATLKLSRSELVENVASTSGGVMYTDTTSTVSLDELTIATNRATFGGAIYNAGSVLAVRDTDFRANSARDTGGAAHVSADSDATFVRVSMLGNGAMKYGGGLYVSGAVYSVLNSVFNGNHTSNTGAGIYQWSSAEGTLDRVSFVQNVANYGVGLMVFSPASVSATRLAFVGNESIAGAGLQVDGADLGDGTSMNVEVRDASFWRNQASDGGAALLVLAGARPTLASTTFGENAGNRGGAVLSVIGAEPVFTNVTFLSNSGADGGALFNGSGSHSRLLHASFFGNTARDDGGGLYSDADSTTTVANSVFWGSVGSGPDLVGLGSAPAIDRVAAAQTFTGTGNIVLAADPFDLGHASRLLFLDQGRDAPSAIDAGSNALADDPLTGFEALDLPSWSALTTSADGSFDEGNVDLGRHYSPGAAYIQTFGAETDKFAWQTVNVDQCTVFNDVDATVSTLELAAVAQGSRLHGYASDTELTLVCFGPIGEPAVAFARVP